MKILVGLSGGVDSSVAAYMLKKAGHDVYGATMSIWDKNAFMKTVTGKDACFSPHEEDDIATAKKLCEQLDIPYFVFDCTEQYKKLVLQNFKSEYLAGRTPNPCVICNSTIKFSALPEKAKASGLEFDKFATGHYARVVFDDKSGKYYLKSALHNQKDQSYFLYRLNQEQLSKIVMPLGEYTKEEIRQIAKEAGLEVHDKPDSQDFYSGDINDILQTEPKKGNFVDSKGKILGQHNGIWNYTVGQRRGLGISAEKPLYVLALRPNTNEVVLGFIDESLKDSLIAKDLIWSAISAPDKPFKCSAKIRSSQPQTPVEVIPLENGKVKVKFDNLQKAVAPGQSVVFYDGDTILGGGFIELSE